MNKVEDLKIWKKSIALAKEVYMIVKDLPIDEKFGLTSQIKRSSVSVASNIAEGAGRNSPKEFAHFLSIANGSSYELQTQLILAYELNFLDKSKVHILLDQIIQIQKMNYSLQKNIR